MEQQVIQQLTQDYGPAKWISKSIFGFKQEGWFLLETTPLPPLDEIEQVVSDIIFEQEIDYYKGQVRHWPDCKNPHVIKDRVIKKVISSLKEETFRIGVCTGNERMLEGQPIVIALKPTISYMNFPDHPHLNSGGGTPGHYLPDSFCYGYTSEKERYGPSTYEKFIRVFDESILFLFRHQVWLAVRNELGEGQWIGPGYKLGLPSEVYPEFLNPMGKCRCGKNTRYAHCHLPSDLRPYVERVARTAKKPKKEIEIERIRFLYQTWKLRVENPHKDVIQKLNLMLK